jgi:hypothetical protein
MLTAALVLAALVAGATGSWSPCGFSMVDTIGRAEGGRRATAASCVTFFFGALVGGVGTFASLGFLGRLVHGAGGAAAAAVAVAIAVAAAAGELRGVRIVPQIRRQVPEPWRRVLPLPLATAAYGVLLGLGFTTFVLTFGVWALAAISFALGEPRLGAAVGIAFGLGRALPVVTLAPFARWRFLEPLGESVRTLRGFRLANAVALLIVAAAVGAVGASAAALVASTAGDPAVANGYLAWDGSGGARLRRERAQPHFRHFVAPPTLLPGTDPALGGRLLAWRSGAVVHVVRLRTRARVLDLTLPGVDALAVSSRWLVYRTHRANGGDRIAARSLARPGRERAVASIGPPGQLGHPAMDGGTVVYHVAGVHTSRIVSFNLISRRRRVVRASDGAQLTNPSLLHDRLLYVIQTNLSQRLVVGRLRGGGDRTLYAAGPPAQRDSGHEAGHSSVTRTPPARPAARFLFWTTALSARYAYLTLLPRDGGRAGAHIIRIRR